MVSNFFGGFSPLPKFTLFVGKGHFSNLLVRHFFPCGRLNLLVNQISKLIIILKLLLWSESKKSILLIPKFNEIGRLNLRVEKSAEW